MKNSNQDLAARQIMNHGVDRYPTTQTQFIKLVEEVGELGKEMNRPHRLDKIRGEMADVQLALAELANKLGIDLDDEVKSKVENDHRKF